jgi:hypothetical protein
MRVFEAVKNAVLDDIDETYNMKQEIDENTSTELIERPPVELNDNLLTRPAVDSVESVSKISSEIDDTLDDMSRRIIELNKSYDELRHRIERIDAVLNVIRLSANDEKTN